MCSFVVVLERSITKCDLINNIIKTWFTLTLVDDSRTESREFRELKLSLHRIFKPTKQFSYTV
jgi:hypothetical protein